MTKADYVIVGAGSAGAVLAARLSENPVTRVVLIEAGIDTPPEKVPADIEDLFPSSSLNLSYFWPGLQASRRDGGPTYPFPQARVMGGGSSIMGMWALRGIPTDFERWREAGATGWGADDVLPFYQRLENDLDRQGGPRGDYTIRRAPSAEWPRFVGAMQNAARARGIGSIADINETPGDGFFPFPVSQSARARSSSASIYLTQAVRRRPNLRIMTGCRVQAITFEGRRANGVTFLRDGEQGHCEANEVIVSAGAIHSPALLIRSGVGPADQLAALGIAPVAVRDGIGRNLQNHSYLNFALTVPPAARQRPQVRNFVVAGLRLSSGLEPNLPQDLIVYAIGRVSGQPWGNGLAMVGAALYAPLSRGEVRLVTPDPDVEPQVNFNLLSDPRDAPRMVKAARAAEELLFASELAGTYHDAFLLPPIMAADQFNRTGIAGAIFSRLAKLVLDAPSIVSRTALKQSLGRECWVGHPRRRVALSDERLLSSIAPQGHVTSTCAMGRPDDARAVVDEQCRVYGVDRLRVVDASIMPWVPSANTNLTTLMIAEKVSSHITSAS